MYKYSMDVLNCTIKAAVVYSKGIQYTFYAYLDANADNEYIVLMRK